VNGTLSSFFGSSCGLRQGDPLSHFLFVIVMEALSRIIFATVDGGFLLGFFVGSREVNISYLLFVDDTLVFYGAKPDHLHHQSALFLCFEAISKWKINLAISELVLVGIVENVDGLAGIMGCGVSFLPMKYLGLPLGASFRAKSIWDDVIEKGLPLSIAPFLICLRYFMSIFPLPVGVANCIEKLQRDFLCGRHNEEFKFHLVSWSKACSPISKRGLGVWNLEAF
jgi:hypothetical protein